MSSSHRDSASQVLRSHTVTLSGFQNVSHLNIKEGVNRVMQIRQSAPFLQILNPPIFLFKSETTTTFRNRSVKCSKLNW